MIWVSLLNGQVQEWGLAYQSETLWKKLEDRFGKSRETLVSKGWEVVQYRRDRAHERGSPREVPGVILYSIDKDAETMSARTPEEAVNGIQKGFGTVKVYAWKPEELPSKDDLARNVEALVMEYLDVNYASSCDDPTEVPFALRAAFLTLASMIRIYYEVRDMRRWPEGDVEVTV